MIIYVYGLHDPLDPNRIRYVGATSDLTTRINQHANGRDATTRPWIKEMLAQGRMVSHRVLETSDAMNGSIAERRWIDSFPETDLLNVRLPDRDCYDFRVTPIIPMRDMQILYIRWAMDRFGGNKQAVARALGIGRQTLYNMLRKANT